MRNSCWCPPATPQAPDQQSFAVVLILVLPPFDIHSESKEQSRKTK